MICLLKNFIENKIVISNLSFYIISIKINKKNKIYNLILEIVINK
jgi:hypothetical protein